MEHQTPAGCTDGGGAHAELWVAGVAQLLHERQDVLLRVHREVRALAVRRARAPLSHQRRQRRKHVQPNTLLPLGEPPQQHGPRLGIQLRREVWERRDERHDELARGAPHLPRHVLLVAVAVAIAEVVVIVIKVGAAAVVHVVVTTVREVRVE